MPDTEKHQKGFTLIEIAIVLVIVGLLIGMGASLMGPLTRRVKNNETKEIVNAAVESLLSYGASNNELPDTVVIRCAIFPPVQLSAILNVCLCLRSNFPISSSNLSES